MMHRSRVTCCFLVLLAATSLHAETITHRYIYTYSWNVTVRIGNEAFLSRLYDLRNISLEWEKTISGIADSQTQTVNAFNYMGACIETENKLQRLHSNAVKELANESSDLRQALAESRKVFLQDFLAMSHSLLADKKGDSEKAAKELLEKYPFELSFVLPSYMLAEDGTVQLNPFIPEKLRAIVLTAPGVFDDSGNLKQEKVMLRAGGTDLDAMLVAPLPFADGENKARTEILTGRNEAFLRDKARTLALLETAIADLHNLHFRRCRLYESLALLTGEDAKAAQTVFEQLATAYERFVSEHQEKVPFPKDFRQWLQGKEQYSDPIPVAPNGLISVGCDIVSMQLATLQYAMQLAGAIEQVEGELLTRYTRVIPIYDSLVGIGEMKRELVLDLQQEVEQMRFLQEEGALR